MDLMHLRSAVAAAGVLKMLTVLLELTADLTGLLRVVEVA